MEGGSAPRLLAFRGGRLLTHMRPQPDEYESLRLAAKASDRAKASNREWPEFERRLTRLGYTPRSIAHAFTVLSGPGTVDEALAILERDSR